MKVTCRGKAKGVHDAFKCFWKQCVNDSTIFIVAYASWLCPLLLQSHHFKVTLSHLTLQNLFFIFIFCLNSLFHCMITLYYYITLVFWNENYVTLRIWIMFGPTKENYIGIQSLNSWISDNYINIHVCVWIGVTPNDLK